MEKNSIFQHNTYQTLASGFYKGTTSWKDVMNYGNDGLATLDGASGEVTIIDGVAYLCDAKGQIREVKEYETMPYVALVELHETESVLLENMSSKVFYAKLLKIFKKNSLYAVKVRGSFKHMEVANKLENNEGPYDQVLARQVHYSQDNVSGILLGIASPEHLINFYGPTYHLHFMSDDLKFGGHVDHFEVESVIVDYAQIDEIHQDYAGWDPDFQKINLI
ncbi:acetolactate decarboxylase [Lactovum miscens]|uniref:Alpha-acetolactate decarboxylase n=1 Tax=Lactovum miscens TaxID=190387 RepID=A0A841C605_9LACT|nr:acetolactate decarboxylase [Lactovum miscens]MBB5888233.1 acetolactate decarboxylase [Lactovum miscens]